MSSSDFMFDDIIHIPEIDISIYQPLVPEVKRLGDKEFNRLLMPFTITLKILEAMNVDTAPYKEFDLFFIKYDNGISIMQSLFEEENININEYLVKGLKFFTKSENVFLFEEERALVVNDKIIDRDNFNYLQEVILKATHSSKLAIEKPPTFKSERQKQVHEKMKKHRQKHMDAEILHLKDIINIVLHGGKSFIPYKKIAEFTYWQLVNSYKAIMTIDEYQEFMRYKVSEKYDVQKDIDHWSKSLKLI